ncbi:MAG: response regulator, partial [Thermoanaerobaculia bacterium]|nr:response regulator [Thermoanaerobaculia bacterium]
MGKRVLVVDDEAAVRDAIRMTLEYEGYQIEEAKSGKEGIEKGLTGAHDVILLDIKMPVVDGMEVLDRYREGSVTAPVIVVSGHGDVRTAVEATKRGAYDFIEKPLNRDRLLLSVRNATTQHRLGLENLELKEQQGIQEIVGQSEPVEELREQIHLAAPTTATVLIEGESGTGKELAAREIHSASSRA